MKRLALLTAAAALALAPPAAARQPYPQDYGSAATLVDGWYLRFLGRAARADPGSRGWVRQLANGHAPDAVLAGILGSEEYYTRAGRRPETFVEGLFRDVLGRRPTPREYDHWVRRAYIQDAEDLYARRDIAYDLLTQNPGSWRSASAPQAQPRERYDYDYRRPYYPYRR